MSKHRHQLSREAQAHAEIGQTDISRRTAGLLCLGFLALVLAVPLAQGLAALYARRAGEVAFPEWLAAARAWHEVPVAPFRWTHPVQHVLHQNRRLLRTLHTFEDELEEVSIAGRFLRPRLQQVFTAFLGVGNEQVYVGRQGWLFYRADLESVTGPGFLEPARLAARAHSGEEWEIPPQPDPRPAVLAMQRELAARGIMLVLMPTPVKPSVDPRYFARRTLLPGDHPRNRDYQTLAAELAQEGIVLFDPLEILQAMAPAGGRYLATDTHWRPESMQAVAAALARTIEDLVSLAPVRAPELRTVPAAVSNAGDLTRMLDLPAGRLSIPDETATIAQVLTADDQFWRPDPQADILLLGDSFSNVFSLEAMGWGEAAGLAEHLSLALQRPVDRITRNDAGAHATRAMLSAELARGVDRLAGKRVVIWQFAERELAQGDWRMLPLRVGSPPPSRFIHPAPGETLTVQGVVQEAAAAPRPGTVPYRDHIVAVHLADIEDPEEAVSEGQALVYLWSMRDNRWTDAARLRRGQTITVRLQSWDEVAERLDAINRAELDDLALQLETPSWGTLID